MSIAMAPNDELRHEMHIIFILVKKTLHIVKNQSILKQDQLVFIKKENN